MKDKSCVLVCVTPQLECERLIQAGSQIAKELGLNLEVLSVFQQKDGFKPNPEVLEHLYECARIENANMSVYFNDNPAILAAVYAKKYGAKTIVAGFPKERSTQFIASIHTLIPDIPISMVDNNDSSKIYHIIPQEKQPKYEIIGTIPNLGAMGALDSPKT